MLSFCAQAQGPNGTMKYYKLANGLAGEELKDALSFIIGDPGVVNYSGLKAKYVMTDTRADGYLRDWYSDVTSYEPGSNFGSSVKKEGDGYNREHLMPQSWYDKKSPMVSDITQVVPTDAYLNSRRNDLPFGEVVSDENRVKTSLTGYSKWGAPREDLGTPASVTTVFEPNDKIKGDIARIYFYMSTCYQDSILTWTYNNATEVLGGTKYCPILDWEMNVLKRWSKLDPVDEVEMARNDSVYKVQGNRNPFVDFPGLEDYVWGEKAEQPFSYDFYEGIQQDPDNLDDDSPEDEPFTEATIALNNAFFITTWNGSRPTSSNEPTQIIGKKGNVSVVYAKGDSGQNMFCNGNEIRLYKHNTLKLKAYNDTFTEITFVGTKSTSTKELFASTGTMDDLHWTGNASVVQFKTDSENGNIRLYTADLKMGSASTGGEATGIEMAETETHPTFIYGPDGLRRSSLQPGLNIVVMKNGKTKKILVTD